MAERVLQFVHISDTHLLHPGQHNQFGEISPELAQYAAQIMALPYHPAAATEALVEEINRLPLKIDFVLHSGDVSGQQDADYEFSAALLGQINYPLIYLPGNHDLLAEVERCLCQVAVEPVSEYEYGGVQIVCLDSSRYGQNHAGWLDETQLERLKAICCAPDERPLVVATHHHPLQVDVPWLDALGLLNGEAMHQILLLARSRLRGVFFGHIHHSIDILKDGILYSGVASAAYQFLAWPGQAQAALDLMADPGFNVVTITRGETFVRHHRYRIPGVAQP